MFGVWFMLGFFGFMAVFYAIFFIFILPRIRKMNARKKREAEELKIRKEQMKTSIEKEKLERELAKQRFQIKVELEAKNAQPKFCQYCGSKIPPDSHDCSACGAKIKE